MSSDGRNELHEALIQDHFRRPRNHGPLDAPARTGRAHNPFCGDTVQVWVRTEDGRLAHVTFDGRGCSISQASASMMTVLATGKTAAEVQQLREAFVAALRPPGGAPLPEQLGDLRALEGVRKFPSRIRCAVLAFDALVAALEEEA